MTSFDDPTFFPLLFGGMLPYLFFGEWKFSMLWALWLSSSWSVPDTDVRTYAYIFILAMFIMQQMINLLEDIFKERPSQKGLLK